MKEDAQMTVISGFRVYGTRGDDVIENGGDAPPYTLTYAPWEPAVEPTENNSAEEEDDADVEDVGEEPEEKEEEEQEPSDDDEGEPASP